MNRTKSNTKQSSLTFLEALEKSLGNRLLGFRRKIWRKDYIVEASSNGLFHTNQTDRSVSLEHRFCQEGMLSTDWENVPFSDEKASYEVSDITYNGEPLYRRIEK